MIDALSAPALVAWQLTRNCDLACRHCCTGSAPGRALPGELGRERAMALCREIADARVPYVLIAGGEPTLVPHFLEVCRALSDGGVWLKVETNGQAFDPARLAGLAVRSVQVSIDGATEATFARQRALGSLSRAEAACRSAVAAGLPLEVTFAPSRLNLHEAGAVVDLAASLGAFRFNTGMLMRIGTAARFWPRLEPTPGELAAFRALLARKERDYAGRMELCWRPFTLLEEAASLARRPSASMPILPDGRVKVAGPLPFVCADLKHQTLPAAWDAFRAAWKRPAVKRALERLASGRDSEVGSDAWVDLDAAPHMLPVPA